MVIDSELISEIADKIPIIIGPTAVGKTKFAIHLAKKLNGEIISVDSRQIYRGFKIGTAQPTIAELNEIPHHLVNCKNPEEIISAGKYIYLIKDKITDLLKNKIKPIIAGGTMLYVNSLCFGIINNADSNPIYRQKYFEQIQNGEIELLQNKLKSIDPEYANIVSDNDYKKLVRALEIFELTGSTPSKVFEKQSKKDIKERAKYYLIEICMNREDLRNKIHNRTIQMMDSGWVKEVKNLLISEITENSHPMQSVGYKQIISYLDGQITKEEVIKIISTKTWQYAKKQLTWLKKMDIDLQIQLSKS